MAIKQELEKKEKRTCLYDKHISLGATMVTFGGFDMPLLYQNAGIAPEHMAVREHVGLFDVSHMGEVTVKGKDAERYVQHIFTNDIAGAPVGKIYYGMMCYENGGTVDDLLVYKLGENDFFLVINAANIDKDWAWLQEHAAGFDIDLQNRSDFYGQIALQGPESEDIMERVLSLPCKELSFYTCKTIGETLVSRTGYTGEDGFEVYGTHDFIRACWDKLIAAGVQACGLGCRDTLRFEVGLPLYGDELSEEITPIMAGLGMFVKFDKAEFIGKAADVYGDIANKYPVQKAYATYKRAELKNKLDNDMKNRLAKADYQQVVDLLMDKADRSKSENTMLKYSLHYLMFSSYLDKNIPGAKNFAEKILTVDPEYKPALEIKNLK